MKAYTDISQSKKLAEILPLDSADMYYFDNLPIPKIGYEKEVAELYDKTNIDYIPCWSLAALLNVLPHKLKIVLAINDYYQSNTVKDKYAIGSVANNNYDCYADNPVDACYELILKLHEQNLI